MKIELQPNETKIDTWSILYIPPGGGKYNGKLTITSKRLFSAAVGVPSILYSATPAWSPDQRVSQT